MSLVLAMVATLAITQAGWATEVLEQIIERDYPIEPTAKFSLRNTDGSVLIYGADINEMKLQAIKKAYTKDRLDKIDVDVAVQPNAVTINTSYPPKSKWGFRDRSGTVDYVIILPWNCDIEKVELANGEMLIEGMRGDHVRADLGNGRLSGHNCFTDLHLTLGNGGLDVSYDWWETHFIGLDVRIAEGNTRLFIPGDAQFQLHAETPNGHIVSDFASKENRAAGGQKNLDLVVGGVPNAQMKLQAFDGSIRIKEANP